MEREYEKILIRNATVEDAETLCTWWNDGTVMAHAGFPDGLHTTVEEIKKQIMAESDDITRRHIILYEDKPIGEMNYRNLGNKICEIGIKICEREMQNRGLGKIILSLFIDGLFHELGYEKILLDTNVKNTRAQHVYEQLGFRKVRTNVDAWKDQHGIPQSSIDYKLIIDQFRDWR